MKATATRRRRMSTAWARAISMAWARATSTAESEAVGRGRRQDRGRHVGRGRVMVGDGLADGGCGGRRGRGGRRTPRGARWRLSRAEIRDGEPVGRAAWACAAWEPAKVSSVTLTAATTHTATADGGDRRSGIGPDAVPAHPPDRLARMLANHVDSARRTTRRRYATASSAVEVQQAQDLLPQFRRERGQRQQAGKRRRAQRAPARDERRSGTPRCAS